MKLAFLLPFFLLSFFSSVHGSCSDLANVDGLIFDLDGTVYEPQGLIAGAQDLYKWMLIKNMSFVFLSNSGAKGPEGVQAKFQTPTFQISPYPVPLSRIYTAAQGIAHFMLDYVPKGSYVYVIQSTSKFGNLRDSCLKVINRTVPYALFNSWTLRTDLSMDEAKLWAQRSLNQSGSTFVVTCADGMVSDDQDPVTGKPGYTDWSFDLLSKATWLIQNGAILVNHAPDTHNAVYDPNYPSVKLATPGPGTFFSLLRSATYPDSVERLYVTGKGGNLGVQYMVEPAIKLLQGQRSSGNRKRIAIVGDTLDTDILVGNDAEILTIFVLSGVHTKQDLKYYPVNPTCILPSIASIPQYIKV